MTAAARLLAEVAAAGAVVVLDGAGMKVKGATALPDSLVQELRTHRDEIREVLQPKPRGRNSWPPDIQKIIDWFLTFRPPNHSFLLKQGVTITDPAKYWEYLRSDIAPGPKGARARYDALQADLRRLHKLFAEETAT